VAVPFTHPLLRVPTPNRWVERAAQCRDLLLIDHANCEKKAASTALALMFAYAEDLELAERMSRLAREELRHYEQVARLIRSLQIAPQRLAPGRYAQSLRRLVASSEPQREIDLMICGACIEARSSERFAALAPALTSPLDDFFAGLHKAEARHFKVYMDLARRAAARHGAAFDGAALDQRIDAFTDLEARLIDAPDEEFRFHSGPPALASLHSS
jgi:tRNA 2-(methylsulfanyl)-N6-isopentenyladenosine37 hydroxylase